SSPGFGGAGRAGRSPSVAAPESFDPGGPGPFTVGGSRAPHEVLLRFPERPVRRGAGPERLPGKVAPSVPGSPGSPASAVPPRTCSVVLRSLAATPDPAPTAQ